MPRSRSQLRVAAWAALVVAALTGLQPSDSRAVAQDALPRSTGPCPGWTPPTPEQTAVFEQLYGTMVDDAANANHVPSAILRGLIYQESRWDPGAYNTIRSKKTGKWTINAAGMMQFVNSTARVDMHLKHVSPEGVRTDGCDRPAPNPADERMKPDRAVPAGAKYLRRLYDAFASIPCELERWRVALGAYNRGIGTVRRAIKAAKRRIGTAPTTWSQIVGDLNDPEGEGQYYVYLILGDEGPAAGWAATRYAYTGDDCDELQSLYATGKWRPGDPPVNAQGLREAVHVQTGLAFVLIPKGSFDMGSAPNDRYAYEDERPRHRVTLSRSFLLCKTECTQAAYRAVTGLNPSYFIGDALPAEGVSWIDATAFCAAADLRLPTEAEWEYACRAGTTTRYSFGDDEGRLGEFAWYEDNSGPHPVGQKTPNPFGLLDMLGNVWEWCEDKWHDTYNGAPTDGRAWVNPPGASIRVFRGGMWTDSARDARTAYRGASYPDGPVHFWGFGFRPARDVTTK